MSGQQQPPIMVHSEVGSTNDEALKALHQGAPHGSAVVAEQQSAGRGRREDRGQRRVWYSPANANVYLSVVLRPKLDASRISGITLACGVAIAQALRELGGGDVRLKWPNDLYIGDRKLGGILSEAATGVGGLEGVVVGVGINVNVPGGEFPAELRDQATSLLRENGRVFDRLRIIQAVRGAILGACAGLEAGGLEDFMEAFDTLDAARGREVRFEQEGVAMRGVADGLSAQGGLWVKRDTGERAEVMAGEVTICGLGRGKEGGVVALPARPAAEVEAYVEQLLTAQPAAPPQARRVRRRFKLRANERVGARYCRLEVEVDAEFAASYLRPGQYTTVGIEGHPPNFYVIAGARGPVWEFLIEAEGDLGSALSELGVGAEVEVSLAEGGGFEPATARARNALLFASGSGIAAVLPLIDRWLEAPGGPESIALFYGERHEHDRAYAERLRKLEEAGVAVYLAAEEGREFRYVQDAFEATGLPVHEAAVYVSGAAVMIKAVTERMMAAGIDASRIHINI
ncbi:biotin--[acetyl-CoA-carboxylase] ligase [Lujinxingia vulgaris]|uniref:biotin--[biotin carboxyl-carrier protein] ligase n=1 Tax=Lujinxingia vulgaris TaxID=2600176 RepID=A0A5C6XER2_9DELT|nr:biotin--[acetyl-CoA-carboxylase] ligase [Lujinxingia vulgaris]TXD35908.1 biotin--[acetyl-CoA-carboxylase] ligase [Lujinxingia vulgaris]